MNFASTKPRSACQSLEQMAMLAIPVEDGKLARLARNLRNLCIFVHGQTHSVLTRVVAGPSSWKLKRPQAELLLKNSCSIGFWAHMTTHISSISASGGAGSSDSRCHGSNLPTGFPYSVSYQASQLQTPVILSFPRSRALKRS